MTTLYQEIRERERKRRSDVRRSKKRKGKAAARKLPPASLHMIP